MFSPRQIACAAMLSLGLANSHAEVRVDAPWARATVPGQTATGVFMRLSSDQATRLVAVASPLAGIAEVHEMTVSNGMMRMRKLERGLDLPANATVELKPGSFHLMLMDLKRPLREGESVPLALTLETRDGTRRTLELSAPVRPLASEAPPAAHQH